MGDTWTWSLAIVNQRKACERMANLKPATAWDTNYINLRQHAVLLVEGSFLRLPYSTRAGHGFSRVAVGIKAPQREKKTSRKSSVRAFSIPLVVFATRRM